MNGKKIIYQVFTRLWGDGSLSSWDKSDFEHIKSLGADYVWLTGIPRHASGKPFVKGDPGSPYAVSDWYDINPYLLPDAADRTEAFREFVKKVHKSGLKCLVDFIPNHVAQDYSGALGVYPWHDGDWTDTLKVDWSNPSTIQEFEHILLFWSGLGVDGFRCDMVELVPPEALKQLIHTVKIEFPDLLFLAEVYGRDSYSRYINDVGFDLLYDKSGVYDILRGVIEGKRSAQELTWNWQFLGPLQSSMLNFLENHDEQRLASRFFAGDADRAWAAVAYAMLFNRASWMYYAGQEAGEEATESSDGRTSIFNWCKPSSLSLLDSMIHHGSALPDKNAEILGRYKRLGTLARSSLFALGEVWDLGYCNQSAPGFDVSKASAFMRFNGTDAMLVLCNFSDKAVSTELAIPAELQAAAGINKSEASLYAPAYGYALLKCL